MRFEPPHREERLDDQNRDAQEQSFRQRQATVVAEGDDRQNDDECVRQIVRQRHAAERLERPELASVADGDREQTDVHRREQFARDEDGRRIRRRILGTATVVMPDNNCEEREGRYRTDDGRPGQSADAPREEFPFPADVETEQEQA